MTGRGRGGAPERREATRRGPFDPTRLFQALDEAQIDYIMIGGLALGAHGAPRGTKDLDICPNPDAANLGRLADFLASVHAKNIDEDEFDADELPNHDLEGLQGGGDFRLLTDLGPLNVMQYLEPFEDDTWGTLDKHSEERHLAGVTIRVCGYEDLLQMKEAAGRGQDRIDVNNLKAARREL
jgi:hypothetical protein